MHRYRFLTPITLIVILFVSISIYSTNEPVSADNSALESEANSTQIPLPFGQSSFKIEVAQDGIYELTYSDLSAAGMNVASVNPQTFQLIHRGQSVDYSFIGNSDSKFDSNEKILFYGTAFDGSDYEKQYISSNYYWLWANGTPSAIESVSNSPSKAASSAWKAVEVTGPDDIFNTGYFKWEDDQVNEPDAWFWAHVKKGTPETLTVDLKNPATGAGDAKFSAEFITTYRSDFAHDVSFTFGSLAPMTKQVYAPRTDRIEGTLPASALANGSNTVAVSLDTTSTADPPKDYLLIDQITIEYWRQYIAEDNQLIFTAQDASTKSYNVTGMTGVNANNVLVWDVTNPLAPTSITIGAADVSASSVAFELDTTQDERTFIVTTDSNIQSPSAISKYTANSIEPQHGAEWLAISHEDFIGQTNRLATYRRDVRFMSTHVVDVEDIINQYGYGYNMPTSIQKFVQHAVNTWPTAPEYLLLVGDATQNPQQRSCTNPICYNGWDASIETYVVTDLIHDDRFLGLTPSDHIYARMSGDEIAPDIAVGRFAVRDNDTLSTLIDKTIRYEEAVYAKEPWTKHLIWVADDADTGGDFCLANKEVRDSVIPAEFSNHVLCPGDH